MANWNYPGKYVAEVEIPPSGLTPVHHGDDLGEAIAAAQREDGRPGRTPGSARVVVGRTGEVAWPAKG